MYHLWAIQKCHRHTYSHIQKGMSWDTEPDLQAPPVRPCVTQQPRWPGWEKNMHICLAAAKWLQLFFPAYGNGPDQWKTISFCNPNTWNFRNILWNTLWKCNPCHQGRKPKCTFPNTHSPIFTVCNGSPHPIFSILWYKELADPEQKNLSWSPKLQYNLRFLGFSERSPCKNNQ